MTPDPEPSLEEQIRATIEESSHPELSIREVMERTSLDAKQIVTTADSMEDLRFDSAGVLRLSGGDDSDDNKDLRCDGGGEAVAAEEDDSVRVAMSTFFNNETTTLSATAVDADIQVRPDHGEVRFEAFDLGDDRDFEIAVAGSPDKLDQIGEQMQEIAAVTREQDSGVDEDEATCDHCSFSGTERGVSVHEAQVHNVNKGGRMKQRIVDILREHGELPSKKIRMLLETTTDPFPAINELEKEGRIETRPDPEDRRRTLYRLVDDSDEGDTGGDDSSTNHPDADRDQNGNGEEHPDEDDADGEDDEEQEADHDDTDAGDGDAHREDSVDDQDDEQTDDGTVDEAPDSQTADIVENEENVGEEPDEESESSGSQECCGLSLSNLEYVIHRTEEHGVELEEFNNLAPGEFEDIVEDADSIPEVADQLGWTQIRVTRALGIYGRDEVTGGDSTFRFDSDLDDQVAPDQRDEGEPETRTDAESVSRAVNLQRFGVIRREVIDALEGAQSIHHVRRDLGISRRKAKRLLDEMDLLDQVQSGCPPLSPKEAESAVRRGAT